MIVLTGASGFVGSRIAAQLRGAGVAVRGLVRARTAMSHAADVAIGDITSVVDWRRVLDGATAVIHAAGLAHQPRRAPDDLMHRVNAQATDALAAAAAACGVRRLVYLSSAKVMGDHSGARTFAVTDTPQPSDAYSRSKLAGERALQEAQNAGVQTVVLRPPLVYGPGVRANFLSLLRLCDGPWPLPFGSVTARRSLVYLDNLASAAIASAQHPAAAAGTFFVTDGTDLTVAELVTALRQALGRPPRLLPVPAGLLRAALQVGGRADLAVRLLSPFRCDSLALTAQLGWTPPVPVHEGLQRTTRWYQSSIGQAATGVR